MKMAKLGSVVLMLSFMAYQPVTVAASAKGLVAKKAAIIKSLHKKAKKALVNAAQDNSYADFMLAEGATRETLRPKIDKVSLNVQKKFKVAEMCLIDAKGPELARIVGNEIANDLSPDESGAVFFAPGFSQKPRTVYISPLYMSPDADKWVLAYVTPVLAGGETKAILHYEHGLDVYQNALKKGVKAGTVVLAVNKDGWVISDSRNDIAVAKNGEHEDEAHYFKKLAFGDVNSVIKTLNSGGQVSDDSGTYAGAAKKSGAWTIMVLNKG
jgi:hypothetical protein